MPVGPIRCSAVAAALLIGPELLGADHPGVEQAGLVQGVCLVTLMLVLPGLGLLRLLALVRVVRGLLGVVALVGVGIGMLVAVRVLLGGVRLLRVAAVGVGLLLVGVRRLRLSVVLLLGGMLGRGLLLREGGQTGEVVGVAGVLDGAVVVGEGAEVVGGDPAVQLLPAAADGVQGLGEDRLEGAQLGVDVLVGGTALRLRVVAALGGVLVLVALLVGAGAVPRSFSRPRPTEPRVLVRTTSKLASLEST